MDVAASGLSWAQCGVPTRPPARVTTPTGAIVFVAGGLAPEKIQNEPRKHAVLIRGPTAIPGGAHATKRPESIPTMARHCGGKVASAAMKWLSVQKQVPRIGLGPPSASMHRRRELVGVGGSHCVIEQRLSRRPCLRHALVRPTSKTTSESGGCSLPK